MKKFALSLVVLLAACTEDVRVEVQCEIKEGPHIECGVHQTKGKGEVEACWDFKASCPNGASLTTDRMCQKVKDGGTATLDTPADKLKISGSCDGGKPTVALTNLTINGKSAK